MQELIKIKGPQLGPFCCVLGGVVVVSVVIPAAGFGQRMGSPVNKQYLLLDGIPVVGRTLQVFTGMPEVVEVILVVREDELTLAIDAVVQPYGGGITRVVSGGATRQESVRRGLRAITDRSKIVVIHDGARPLIEQEIVQKVVAEAKMYGAAVAAVPVKDTIKVVANGFVRETLPRETLWAVQTPQAFDRQLILEAHAQVTEAVATDDALLVERLGNKVRIVQGSYRNLKITTPEDLILAEAFLKEEITDAGRNRV